MTAPISGVGVQPEFIDIFQASAGIVEYMDPIVIHGHNEDIDTGTVPEALIPWGGTYSFPSAANTISFVSDSANDTSAGTGARTILVKGLSSTYAEISETVTLNGLTPVVTTNSYLRVNSCYVTTVGSGGVNAGIIAGTHANTSAVCTQINAGEGTNHALVFTVPLNKSFFMSTIECQAHKEAAQGTAKFKFYQRNGSTGVLNQRFELSASSGSVPTIVNLNSHQLYYIEEKSDIYINCSTVTSNNSEVSSIVRGYLVKNDHLGVL